ncbi:hypothetical protein Y032_0064g3503 [Ancylostoma ceylanicum]|uniref:Uncharacterized protein n=1 Tax=Ancylostoma ceylanicum TaxID=53326 RepID=A0A016U093_9BILA|nr:hypothetical protein Y032_0064g3503 [Ancylostoma ceylanicum]
MCATSWEIIPFPEMESFSCSSIQLSLMRSHRNSAPIANLLTFSNLCVEAESSSTGMLPNWKYHSWIAGLEMLAVRGYISVWISFPTDMFLDTASGCGNGAVTHCTSLLGNVSFYSVEIIIRLLI